MATSSNSRQFGVSFSGANNTGVTGFTNSTLNGQAGRLLYGTTQSSEYPNNYANVQWINGIDETRFTWSLAYLTYNNESMPIAATTIGIDDGDYTGTPGEDPAYVRFKGGTNNNDFIAAVTHIYNLNQAAGYTFSEAFPLSNQTADVFLTWFNANVDGWTNFVYEAANPIGESPAPSSYSWWNVTDCGQVEPIYLMRAPQNAILVPNEGYTLEAVIITEGAAPSNHIVIVDQAEEAPGYFAIGSTPNQLTCTA